MGWCSGTGIFDDMAKYVIESRLQDSWKIEILTNLAESLEQHDWDCQSDSNYYNHPVVVEVFAKLHPDWYSPKQRILDKIDMFKKQKRYRSEEETKELLDEISNLVKRE